MTHATPARLGLLVLGALVLGLAMPAPAHATSGCAPAGGQAEAPAKKKRPFGGLIKAIGNAGANGVAGALAGGRDSAEQALKASAQRSVEGAATAALDCLAGASSGGQAAGAQPAAAVQGNAGTATVARRTPAAASMSYPSDIPDPPGFAEVKRAYDDFGKVRCMECEGGYAYDGWVVHPRDEFSSKYNGDAQRIGSWAVGHVHHWKGTENSGTLTVVAEQTVGGFRCRTLQYRLTKGKATAERPGLLCWGRANQYAGSESWNEAY